MKDQKELQIWVREQYSQVGSDSRGVFIGKRAFKEALCKLHPGSKGLIRQAVNKAGQEGLYEQPPQPKPSIASNSTTSTATRIQVQTPTASSSIPSHRYPLRSKSLTPVKTTGTAEQSLVAAQKQSTSAFVFNLPGRSSSDSDSFSQTAPSSSRLETPNGGLSQKPSFVFKAAVAEGKKKALVPKSVKSKSNEKPNDGDINSQFFVEPSWPSFATLDSDNGGVIVDQSDATYSSTGLPASSPNVADLQGLFEVAAKKNISRGIGAPDTSTTTPNLEDQLGLLNLHIDAGNSDGEAANDDIKNAVLFSAKLLKQCDVKLLPQYGLLGSCQANEDLDGVVDPRIFLNTNIPFSAFICGVQGSGKSHTTACLIEDCLIRAPLLGVLQKPLSALVFHYSEVTSRLNFKPSEVAFLASRSQDFPNHPKVPKISVLVSPSNYLTLKPLYGRIPGVTVQPFKIPPKDLTIGTMLTLMSVDTSESAPLYMSQVTKILREMASVSSKAFDYVDFKRQLSETKLDRKQVEFLTQRLDLLESFLDLKGTTSGPAFEAGTVTIIDLSCPFVDVNTACVLFKIGMDIYLESSATTGKLIAVDEAHKYMTDTPASVALTESLLSTIRQQRHHGCRILISTQEPTISPRLIDLCSMTIIHRFSSPDWFSVLRRHISILDDEGKAGALELFQRIVSLSTGEALVFAPAAVLRRREGDAGKGWEKLREGLVRVRVRKRVTWDGGRSIVAI